MGSMTGSHLPSSRGSFVWLIKHIEEYLLILNYIIFSYTFHMFFCICSDTVSSLIVIPPCYIQNFRRVEAASLAEVYFKHQYHFLLSFLFSFIGLQTWVTRGIKQVIRSSDKFRETTRQIEIYMLYKETLWEGQKNRRGKATSFRTPDVIKTRKITSLCITC